MDESAARAIGDETIQDRYEGQVEFLGVQKIDCDQLVSFMCDKWSQGEIEATEPQFEHYISYLKSRPCRPRWAINYLAYGTCAGEIPKVACVTVDDETGAVEFELMSRS